MSDFWTRRRAGVKAERVRADEEAAVFERAEREAALADRTDADVLEDLGLRDPNEMEAGDDFSAFLGEAVPARLKMRALRRLWRVNPVLANVDGLVDYGGDFRDSATVVEDLQTAYQVGKGMAKHVLALAEKAANEDADLPPAVAASEPEAEDGATEEVDAIVEDETRTADVAQVEAEPDIVPTARRMRFSFRGEET